MAIARPATAPPKTTTTPKTTTAAKRARPGRGEHTAEPLARRDPERTYANILDAAVAEFAAKGYGGARVDLIAARSGANKRMLYHYFGNKEALFVAALEQAYKHIRQQEAELHLEDLDPVEAMRRFVSFTFHYFHANPHFMSLLNTENLHRARHIRKAPARAHSINHPIIQRLEALLRRGAAAGLFRPGIDPVQLYISVAGISYFYFSNVHTLSVIFQRDLLAASALAARLAHATDVIVAYLRP